MGEYQDSTGTQNNVEEQTKVIFLLLLPKDLLRRASNSLHFGEVEGAPSARGHYVPRSDGYAKRTPSTA